MATPSTLNARTSLIGYNSPFHSHLSVNTIQHPNVPLALEFFPVTMATDSLPDTLAADCSPVLVAAEQ